MGFERRCQPGLGEVAGRALLGHSCLINTPSWVNELTRNTPINRCHPLLGARACQKIKSRCQGVHPQKDHWGRDLGAKHRPPTRTHTFPRRSWGESLTQTQDPARRLGASCRDINKGHCGWIARQVVGWELGAAGRQRGPADPCPPGLERTEGFFHLGY